MSLADHPVSEKQLKRGDQIVREYAKKGNWAGVVRVIGGAGRADLCDWTPADDADGQAGTNFV